MSNLSQEDINALMGGSAEAATSTSADTAGYELDDMDERDDAVREDISAYFTHEEIDAIGEISNIAMGTSATTMYALLGRRVTITTPSVGLYKAENALSSYTTPFLAISVEYTQGILGKNLLVIKDYDAAVITDLLMGGEGQVDHDNIILNEIHISAMSEVMNQMIGSSATAMANMMDSDINISPPEVNRATPDDDASKFLDGAPLVIKISFDMEIEGLLKSKLMQVMSVEMAKSMIKQLMHPAEAKPEPPKRTPSAPSPAPAASPAPAPRPQQAAAAARPLMENKRVQPVKAATYQSFDEPAAGSGTDIITQINYDLINDIPLQVTVELGKAKKNLSDVLNLGVGSIIVLDKQAGELVDVIVNGKRIAKGEVVVIDENYGVRITEIIR